MKCFHVWLSGIFLCCFVNHSEFGLYHMAPMVKNLPAVQETWVQSLSQKDPLEKGMATLSSILPWRIPMDRGAWRARVHGVAKSRT